MAAHILFHGNQMEETQVLFQFFVGTPGYFFECPWYFLWQSCNPGPTLEPNPGVPRNCCWGRQKTVAWRDKVRFLGVAEKHVVRELLCKQKSFGAPAELRECKEVIIFGTSILCP